MEYQHAISVFLKKTSDLFTVKSMMISKASPSLTNQQLSAQLITLSFEIYSSILLLAFMMPHLPGLCPFPHSLSDHSSVSYWFFSISLSAKCSSVSGLSPWTLLFSMFTHWMVSSICMTLNSI